MKLSVGLAVAVAVILCLVLSASTSTSATATATSYMQPQPGQAPDTDKSAPRRLEYVTIDTAAWKLKWAVSVGHLDPNHKGRYTPDSSTAFTLDPDKAEMWKDEAASDIRVFTSEEAAALTKVLNTLSQYASESTLWYEMGKGKPDKMHTPEAPGSLRVRLQHLQHLQPQPDSYDFQPRLAGTWTRSDMRQLTPHSSITSRREIALWQRSSR